MLILIGNSPKKLVKPSSHSLAAIILLHHLIILSYSDKNSPSIVSSLTTLLCQYRHHS